MSKDSLGDRMKKYEYTTRIYLPHRTYTLIRVDGKAFHTFTRGCDRPYDTHLMEAMDATAEALVREIPGAQLAYTQSDEISVLLTDFARQDTQPWFDGNLQKICSVSAALATAHFNAEYHDRNSLALFDSRVWVVPQSVEVMNYFIWRQQDATRNAISMAAQSEFSHAMLQNKDSNTMQEMLFEKGINFNDYPVAFKRGRAVYKTTVTKPVTFTHKKTNEEVTLPAVERNEIFIDRDIPIFSSVVGAEWLQGKIPKYESYNPRPSTENQEEPALSDC